MQLDCEGKDCAILRGMLKYCDREPLALPRILQFEANHLTPEEEILDTLQSLAQRGFTLRYRTTNNIMVERFYDTTASASAPASATASCHTTQGREEMQGRHEQGHQQPPQSCVGKYYDFIEVGTADWGTLTHYCAKDKHSASPAGEEIWSSLDDLRWVRGIAVDPISEHLQALPDLPQVQKVEAAMDEWSGQDNFWYVSAQNIKAHKGAYWAYFSEDWWSWKVDVMHYAGSLGSLGTPHPNLDFMLRNIGRSDLLEKRIIQVLDWSTLCSRYHVRKVDVVQLDCEGC